MQYIYSLQTILIGGRYGLKDVYNLIMVGYHGLVWLHWSKKLNIKEIPILYRGKLI
jgi:hypothetical protein